MSAEIIVTVDGSSRHVAAVTRVREALDGKAARDIVAARVNGKLFDLTRHARGKRDARAGLDRQRRGRRGNPPFDRSSDGAGGAEPFPGTQVTIGPVIEDGFFYDFAPSQPFTVEDLPEDRAKDARAGEGRPQGRTGRGAARRGDRNLRADGRALQGRNHHGIPEGIRLPLQAGRLDGPVPRTACAVHAATSGRSS